MLRVSGCREASTVDLRRPKLGRLSRRSSPLAVSAPSAASVPAGVPPAALLWPVPSSSLPPPSALSDAACACDGGGTPAAAEDGCAGPRASAFDAEAPATAAIGAAVVLARAALTVASLTVMLGLFLSSSLWWSPSRCTVSPAGRPRLVSSQSSRVRGRRTLHDPLEGGGMRVIVRTRAPFLSASPPPRPPH